MTAPVRPTARDLEVACDGPLLRGAAAALLSAATIREAAGGASVFTEGHPARAVHILLSGQLKVFTLAPNGRQNVLRIVETPGQAAYPAVVGCRHYPVSCESMLASRLLVLPRETLADALRRSPPLAEGFFAELARMQNESIRHLVDLKDRTPLQRLAGYLLGLAAATDGPTLVHLPHQRTVLASIIGVAPENLSRDFGKLAAYGVSSHGPTVAIQDPAALRRLYDPSTGQ